MASALARDAGVHRQRVVRRPPLAVRADDAGVEAIEDVVDLPLVHVYPLDPRRVGFGQAEHVVDRLLGTRLGLRQRGLAPLRDEADDATGLRQPDGALDRLQERVRAARAEAVRVGVVVTAPQPRLALRPREERRDVATDV